jgi:uroporphyrinogen decarboxylase
LPTRAPALTGDKVALQDNVDPATLKESAETIRNAVATTLLSYGEGYGHVCNLGRGITPDVDPGMPGILVDDLHEISPAYKPSEV